MGNLPAWWFFGPAEDAVRAVMERTPRAVLHHDPPVSRHGRLARLLCWAGLHGPEELRYLPQTARLWRVCRRCRRTVSLRVLS